MSKRKALSLVLSCHCSPSTQAPPSLIHILDFGNLDDVKLEEGLVADSREKAFTC